MKDKLSKLIDVKSIVTLILTLVFAGLAAAGKVSPEQFITIFTVIIGFYFGTQYQKKQEALEDQDQETEDEITYFTPDEYFLENEETEEQTDGTEE